LPDNRDKPRHSGGGDDHAGGGQHGGKKPHFGGRPGGPHSGGPRPGGFRPGGFSGGGPRPGGFRPGGFRAGGFSGGPRPGGFGQGDRPEGDRSEGPRQDRPSFEGPRSFGPRPGGHGGGGFDGPRPGGFRPGGFRAGGFDRPRPGGFRAGGDETGGPAPEAGGPRGGFGGPRQGFGGQRPGGYGGPRQGFGGQRPGGPRPGGQEWRPAERDEGERPESPRREWQPDRAWTPRPPHAGGPRRSFGDERPGGPRPGGPRPAYGAPRPGGTRPGGPRSFGPRPERAGFGFGEQHQEFEPRAQSATPHEVEFDQVVSPVEGPHPGRFGEPASFDEVPPVGEAGFDAEGGPDAEAGPDADEPRPIPGPAPMRGPRPVRPGRPDYRARSGGYQPRPFGPGSAPVNRFRPPAPPTDDLLGEDEELVAGRHPVEEAFIARRKAIRLLVVPQRRQALEKLVLHATNLRIPIVEVEGGTLTSLAGFDGHQGIALVTDKRKFAGLEDLLARAIERKEAPFVLVLDSLEDPQNFGSLLRTAEASGVHGVIYPTHRQAPLSAAAIKASAGAVEHLLLVPVDDLAEALADLHVRGLRIVGTDAEAPLTTRQADLRGPVAIVVGSEGQGLGPTVRRRCDTVVRIPMHGHVESLNAAVAGSILLYEASSQRGGDRPTLIADAPAPEARAPRAEAESDADVETTSAEAAVSEAAAFAADISASEPEVGPAAEAPAARPAPRKRAARAGVTPPAEAPAVEAPAVEADDALLPGAGTPPLPAED
jgi:23S rRNA (guanosine2251-2'-O)-methyltransferase